MYYALACADSAQSYFRDIKMQLGKTGIPNLAQVNVSTFHSFAWRTIWIMGNYRLLGFPEKPNTPTEWDCKDCMAAAMR